MAENTEAVLSQRVALGKHSIQTWEQEAHVDMWRSPARAAPGEAEQERRPVSAAGAAGREALPSSLRSEI